MAQYTKEIIFGLLRNELSLVVIRREENITWLITSRRNLVGESWGSKLNLIENESTDEYAQRAYEFMTHDSRISENERKSPAGKSF